MSDGSAPAKQAPLVRLQPLLLGVGFLILIVISAATVWLVNRSAADAARLAQTLSVQNKLSNLLLNVRRAESSQRGYLFTNNSAYLDDFHKAEPEARKLVAELQVLAKSSAQRQTMVTRLSELVDAKFAELSHTISLNGSGRREDARREVIGGHGRDVMTALRGLVEQGIKDEGGLAAVRSGQSRQTNNLLLFATLFGAALIVLIGAISIILVQRNARVADTARRELASTNANLERIVDFRTADLTEANEEIQRFAYIVSHDLRSPLVNIMGFTSELEALRQDIIEQVKSLSAELARMKTQSVEADGSEGAAEEVAIDQLGHDFDEAIRFIKGSTAGMDRLINAVLKLSREGRRQFSPQVLDMNRLVTGVLQTVAHRAAEQGASVTAGDLPPVESDRLAIEQVLANLVDNALKYSRAEEPLQIEITGRANAAHVIYDVRDTGRGIDPKDHQRIFELFRRSGVQDRPGEGIGLAHVRALVRRLGGSMRLTSELGQGSTFTITLPRKWSADSRSAA
jgi:signal transduction histidine kinase